MINAHSLLAAPAMAAVLLFAFAAQAQAPAAGGAVKLVNVAQKEIEVEEGGKRVRKLVEPGKMIPGDEVVYTITYTNSGKQPAERVVITNPVPQHTKMRAPTAEGDNSEIAYSVDGGKTFAPADKLVVTTQNAGGKAATRGAVARDFTHVRWTLKEPLAPGASGFVRFRTVIQ